MPIKSFAHPALVVSNLEKSLAFYRDLLGLKVTYDFGELSGEGADQLTGVPGTKMRILMLQCAGGPDIEIFEFQNPKGRPLVDPHHQDIGFGHIAFNVTQIEEMYQKLVQAGVRVNIPLQEVPGYKFTYLYDPDNALVELVEVTGQ